MSTINRYHKKTLDQINQLYKKVYNKMVCANELAETADEQLAYIKLQDDIKAAYDNFKKNIEALDD